MVPYVTITELLNNVTNSLDVARFSCSTLPSICPLIPHQQSTMQPKGSKIKYFITLILSPHCVKPWFSIAMRKGPNSVSALGSPSWSHALLASLTSVSSLPRLSLYFSTATSVNTSKSVLFSLLYLFSLPRPVFPTPTPDLLSHTSFICLTPIFHKVQA